MTKLIIAGHGKNRQGYFDPGAKGIISKGENKYMIENLFPEMKKYAGKENVVFFSDYDVFAYGNIVELARKYGKDTEVIECHFDAGESSASGGHVIIKSAYNPDKLDLRLRDAIKSMVGVRYNHKGEQGISGRDDLANVNRTASGGINYRLIELGFGTNKTDADIMMNKTDEYARKLMEAILNKKVESEPDEKPKTGWIAQNGKFTLGQALPLTVDDSGKGKLIATLPKNSVVAYNAYRIDQNGYVWIRQKRDNGYGYMATGNSKNGKRVDYWGTFK